MTYPVLFAGPPTSTGDVVIYGLVDPREPGRVRYVGRTTNAAGRYSQHLTPCGGIRGQWVGGIRRKRLYPVMVLLCRIGPQDARRTEKEWIAKMRRLGQADLNGMSPYRIRQMRRIARAARAPQGDTADQ